MPPVKDEATPSTEPVEDAATSSGEEEVTPTPEPASPGSTVSPDCPPGVQKELDGGAKELEDIISLIDEHKDAHKETYDHLKAMKKTASDTKKKIMTLMKENGVSSYTYGKVDFNFLVESRPKHDTEVLAELLDEGQMTEYMSRVTMETNSLRARKSKRARADS
jgi:septal ring factor EnvC (AmiA/AmiB activator)